MTFEQQRLAEEYEKIANSNMRKVYCQHRFEHIYTTVSEEEQVFECGGCGAGMVYNIPKKLFY